MKRLFGTLVLLTIVAASAFAESPNCTPYPPVYANGWTYPVTGTAEPTDPAPSKPAAHSEVRHCRVHNSGEPLIRASPSSYRHHPGVRPNVKVL